MKKKKASKKVSQKRISNTKLMFLSLMLLFIVFEALFVLKDQTQTQRSEVAGITTNR